MKKLQLTHTILKSIRKDLVSGRALWGMLRANEYLSPEDPLYQALAQGAKEAEGFHSDLGNIVLSGKRMSELSDVDQRSLRSHTPPLVTERKFKFAENYSGARNRRRPALRRKAGLR